MHKLFFLQLLDGLTDIEVASYQVLAKKTNTNGALVTNIYSVGGGSLSKSWTKLREHKLPATLRKPVHNQAAFGVTRLIN